VITPPASLATTKREEPEKEQRLPEVHHGRNPKNVNFLNKCFAQNVWLSAVVTLEMPDAALDGGVTFHLPPHPLARLAALTLADDQRSVTSASLPAVADAKAAAFLGFFYSIDLYAQFITVKYGNSTSYRAHTMCTAASKPCK
jgi:hypothetical protein